MASISIVTSTEDGMSQITRYLMLVKLTPKAVKGYHNFKVCPIILGHIRWLREGVKYKNTSDGQADCKC